MGSVIYFDQLVFEILQKIKSCFFKKKTLKYTYQQRDATNGYCQVLNMKLNIGFDIPSKYIEDFCVIVSVLLRVYFQN